MNALVTVPSAKPPSAHPTWSGEARAGEYLSFRIAEEHYAIDILCVQEIRSFEQPTRIANAPSSVVGIINLRGAVVPIVDLRIQLGAASVVHDAFTVVVVVAIKQCVVGLVVDAVSDVVEIQSANLQSAPDFCRIAGPALVQQIALLHRPEGVRMLALLDVVTLLQSPELSLIQQAAEAQKPN